MSVEKTLAERGNRYGDFTDHARIAQGIQSVMHAEPNWRGRLNDVQRQALTVIADKMARILSGDPNYDDNWHDIQGYARLAEERLPETTLEQVTKRTADVIYDWTIAKGTKEWKGKKRVAGVVLLPEDVGPLTAVTVWLNDGRTMEGLAREFDWDTEREFDSVVAYRVDAP